LTNPARYLARPVAPPLTGSVLSAGLGAPFVIAGTLKSIYDLGLDCLFRHVDVDRPRRDPSPVGAQ
jgi:hypothetical protein